METTTRQQSLSPRRKVKAGGDNNCKHGELSPDKKKSMRASQHRSREVEPTSSSSRQTTTPSPDSVMQTYRLSGTPGVAGDEEEHSIKSTPTSSPRKQESQIASSKRGIRESVPDEKPKPKSGSNQFASPHKNSHSRRVSSASAPSPSYSSPSKKPSPFKEKARSPSAAGRGSELAKALAGLRKASDSIKAQSTHDGGSPRTFDDRSCHSESIARLYQSSHHDSPKQVRAKPHWLMERQMRNSSVTPVRQRSASFALCAPPPEGPPESPVAAGKAFNMIHRHKLELNGKELNGKEVQQGLDMDEAVRRRRKWQFEKCAKAAIVIQSMVRGWLVCNRIQKLKNRRNRKKGKKPKKSSQRRSRSRSLSPDNQQHQQLVRASSTRTFLTPKVKGVETLAQRLGSSLHTSSLTLAYDSSTSESDSDDVSLRQDSTALEEELCNIFRSNIAHVTARARSTHGHAASRQSSLRDIGSLPLLT